MSNNVEVKKSRKRSEVRIIPGSKALSSKCEEVRKNINDIQRHNEVAETVAKALNISLSEAFDKLKNPSALTDTYALRKMIRLALLRDDIATDPIKLCRIAEVLCNNISEADMTIARISIDTSNKNDIVE